MGFLFRRPPILGPSVDRQLTRLIQARGAARCLLAIEVVRRLTGDPAGIPAAWERIELPLVQDLPDCPPDAKAPLLRALEDCAAACRHRETARRIMLVRDSLRA